MTNALDQPPPPASPEVQDPAEALRISEERLTLVARATTDTVWDWNVSTNALWWGGRFREVLGLPHYTKVPHTDPMPPTSDVPPRMTAAIASSS